jgi:hypothetical protein
MPVLIPAENQFRGKELDQQLARIADKNLLK